MFACLSLFFPWSLLHSEESTNFNVLVLRTLNSMPTAGGYATNSLAKKNLQRAVTIDHGYLHVDPRVAVPSFCSEATYLLFLKALSILQIEGKLSLSPALLALLLPHNNPDGEGFWGCWNANGPGVARLFHRYELGTNFSDLAAAKPGDFLKIFWTDSIGNAERGHLVIYLGEGKKGNTTYLHYWSSNQPDGYGKHTCRLSKTHHLIFSRLLTPQSLEKLLLYAPRDSYLASLLSSRATSWEEVCSLCRIKKLPSDK